jgi:hypothetical protein
MKALLALMVLAFVTASAYIARVIRGGSSSDSNREQQIRQVKKIILLGFIGIKYVVVIGTSYFSSFTTKSFDTG